MQGRGGAITQGRGGAITQGRGGEIMQGRGGNYRGEQSRRRSPRRPTEAAAFAIVSQQLRPALTAAAASDTGGVVPSGVPTYRSNSYLHLVVSQRDPIQLPDSWDLTLPGEVHEAMQLLMPGPLASKDATWLANIVSNAIDHSRLPVPQPGMGYVGMTEAEVKPLLEAVDFSGCSMFFDPFSGSGTISSVFETAGYQVLNNDLNPYWGTPTTADGLQPGNYLLPYQIIVTSPPFGLLDLAVPLLASKVAVAACVHVPGHWLSNPRAARQQWLSRMAAARRLHIIMGLERGPSHKRCAWLVIFANPSLQQELMRLRTPTLPVSYP